MEEIPSLQDETTTITALGRKASSQSQLMTIFLS
jgi:hypothetical protein